jgi:hypothetical protein
MLTQSLLIGAVVLLAGYIIGGWLWKKDREVEARRKSAGQIAGLLRSKGLKYIPEFLEDYSVGDYAGMGKCIDKAVILIEDPSHAEQVFDQMVDTVNTARAAGKTTDTALAAAVALAKKAADLVAADSPAAPKV